ncbi:DUF7507 domain-containing protein [Microbacterium soli]|uniref:Repeat protein (TIGR01451 family) n=1 Tax=Microbacterium soli TaxID=446075 RepID=A0ABP7N603_9MICO
MSRTGNPKHGSGRGGIALLGAVIATSAMVIAPAAQASPAPDAPQTALVPGAHTVIVPNGVCAVDLTAAGGAGGTAITGVVEAGGAGAVIHSSLAVTPGQSFDVTVGGAGGAGGLGGVGGGGAGGATGLHSGAGGGGYTGISLDGDLLVLAGGGGGTGGGHSLDGGWGGSAGVPTGAGVFAGEDGQVGLDGGPNVVDHLPQAGQGGQVDGPGLGGEHLGDNTRSGFPGVDREGGAGGVDDGPDSGGGGGAGYFGAGGGASTISNGAGGAVAGGPTGAGGGGGSSFVSTDVDFDSAELGSRAQGTDGYATFDWVMCDFDLALTKVASTDVFEDGVPVEYTVTVTNLGAEDMAIGDTVTVTDAKATGGTLLAASTANGDALVCTPAVGETIPAVGIECGIPVTGTTELRGLAVDDRLTLVYETTPTGDTPFENTASVTDRGDQANNTASVVLDPAEPSLELVKSVDPSTIDAAGQELTYSFVITNTGNIAVRDIAISEDSFSGTGDDLTIDCPAVTLQPTDATTCTATYVATQADADAGLITNEATAHGLTPGGNAVDSNASQAVVDVDQKPSLELAKTADVDSVTGADQLITYTFEVTNTGNVTLTDPTVTEGDFSGTGDLSDIVCPVEPLAPGDSIDCTATYTTTAEDAKAATLTNTATASAVDPFGDAVDSAPSTVTLPVDKPLAQTGGDVVPLIVGSAFGVVLISAGVLFMLRRRQTQA